jgi:cytoskeletal protein CcmA (bactofilin family)
MFSKKSTQLLQAQKIAFKSILNKGCTIHGNLEFSGNYTVMGQIVGDVIDVENKNAILWLDSSAYVKGNIQCSNLVLVGKLEGNVVATGAVEVCSGATIIGDIQSNRLHVDSNARINGRLSCLNGENLESVLKNMTPNSVEAQENSAS